jgi:hypothetical protein
MYDDTQHRAQEGKAWGLLPWPTCDIARDCERADASAQLREPHSSSGASGPADKAERGKEGEAIPIRQSRQGRDGLQALRCFGFIRL